MKSSFDSVIPEEMKSEGLFCLWEYEFIDGKLKKPPHNPKYPEFKIGVTDRDKFVPYCEAVEKATYGYSRGQKGYGLDIGIFKDDYMPLGCIDLDHCMIDGKLSPLADDVLRLTEGTYTEISPGGDGLHIFFTFKSVPDGYGQRGTEIECYLAGKVNHTMSVTGKPYKNAPPVLKDLSEVLPQIFDKYLLKQSAPVVQESPTTAPAYHANISDVRRKMQKDYRNLYEDPDGVIAERFDGDHSKADYALCCSLATWTRCNAEQMDTLFRESPLMRDKWDERHSADGKTYGQMTVQRAIDSYQAYIKELVKDFTPSRKKQKFNDFLSRIMRETYKPYPTGLNEVDNILGGGITPKSLVVLTAAPGTGKSTLAQQIFETMGADTLYISLEMYEDQLIARGLSRMLYESNVDLSQSEVLRGYEWTEEQKNRFLPIAERYSETILEHMTYIRPEDNSIDHIMKLIEDYAIACELEGKRAPFIVLDYLHLLSGDKTDDAQSLIKKAVKMLKDYADKHESIVFLISASNRDSNKSGRLTLESGRDSSAIEYTSDVQLALNHKKLFYKKKDKEDIDVSSLLAQGGGEMVLQVLKNRGNPPGKTAELFLDGRHARFYTPTFEDDGL